MVTFIAIACHMELLQEISILSSSREDATATATARLDYREISLKDASLRPTVACCHHIISYHITHVRPCSCSCSCSCPYSSPSVSFNAKAIDVHVCSLRGIDWQFIELSISNLYTSSSSVGSCLLLIKNGTAQGAIERWARSGYLFWDVLKVGLLFFESSVL